MRVSGEARIFVSGIARQDDAGKITTALETWTARDPVIVAAVLEAMRSLLGEPEEEMLLDDAASRAFQAAGTHSGVVVMKPGNDL